MDFFYFDIHYHMMWNRIRDQVMDRYQAQYPLRYRLMTDRSGVHQIITPVHKLIVCS